MTPEGRVKAMADRRLPDGLPGVYRFKPVQNGMGAPALDEYGCYRGVFYAIEYKVPGKDLTDRQKATAAKIVAAGGIVFKVCTKDDLESAIRVIHIAGALNHGGPYGQH